MEANESGKEPPQVRHETKSGERESVNGAGTEKESHEDTRLLKCNDTDDGDSQQNAAPKGATNLKTPEPKGAKTPEKQKPNCTCRKSHLGKCWEIFGKY